MMYKTYRNKLVENPFYLLLVIKISEIVGLIIIQGTYFHLRYQSYFK